MAKARAIIKRRKAVQNIKKITRTMELIATARFRKALDRATQAEAYTRKIAEIVADLRGTSSQVSHPLLEERAPVRRVAVLVLTSNRGLAGSYNGNVLRMATRNYEEHQESGRPVNLEVSGKRGIAFLKFRRIPIDTTYTTFEDRPQFEEVEVLANQYIGQFLRGEIDRLEVVYTKFLSSSRQVPVTETLLPMTVAQVGEDTSRHPAKGAAPGRKVAHVPYEFLPDPASILEEIVPASFKVRLFKCFLDAAVSEQIMRMIAMRGATENADEMVKTLTRQYNRARQSQITRELSEIIGGAAALE
ncbi:ATP synthase F1 subunit gamma [Tautonia plasticadhaerens]|uniref:ATP synthase gamma chain n=1 Tax=Tautonia plasticadhaerens TaxID=2527974 RepID=A0A518H865_9BACT|nr:ATP synthase F1 subunit gamma [Tautonia plasticadhaerens]QDV37043.1 ATP synthase gamma chain [Tautonia plasticadhaerens]